MQVTLKNQFGMVKQVKVGFSWTMLFFGFFVPLLRGDWKHMAISLVAGFFTAGISWIVYPFVYNKFYITDLIKNGWLPTDEGSRAILQQKGLAVVDIAN